MQLFQLRNYNVIFEPVTMSITAFAKIRDKNKDDNLTLKEMSFLWFFTDPRSDFQNIIDEEERKDEIKKAISLPEDWEPDKIVIDAIKFYREFAKTPSSGLYEASMTVAQFIERKLKKPEALLAEEDAKGNPLYKLDSLLRLTKDVPDVMIKLAAAKEQVIQELEAKAELKGGKTKALFEDGI